MPKYVSNKGKWYAAKERIGLKNLSNSPFEYNGETIQPGDDFIYVGPDRQALKELAAKNVEFFGQDFRESSEFQDFINTKYKGNVSLYLKHIGYDEKKDDEEFKEKYEKVNRHELPQRVKEILAMGGGNDMSGSGANHVGGFGEQRLRPVDEVKVKG